MKKKLEAELISIAHRILQLKSKSTVTQLQEEARQLYEKLTILSFSESHFAGPQPTIGQIREALDTDSVEDIQQETEVVIDPIPEPVDTPVSKQQQIEIPIPDVERKPEIIIEEINARVTEDLFIRADKPVVEEISSLDPITPTQSSYEENDKEHVSSTQYTETNDDRPASLNDQLRKDIHIGLNDRLAFVKYLFDGSSPDYNRVLSQLSTLRSTKEAEDFITTMIKPDYNNWQGKEEYEERFMNIILSKF
ncbi:hypothetical protein [Aquimarina longa]|uniref:hypothetical protein n=1 Tax=Aquimarina longa TaxID=1080221 RepID=UPI000783CBF0|nr:hypothetical protein [Aquimarina longa]